MGVNQKYASNWWQVEKGFENFGLKTTECNNWRLAPTSDPVNIAGCCSTSSAADVGSVERFWKDFSTSFTSSSWFTAPEAATTYTNSYAHTNPFKKHPTRRVTTNPNTNLLMNLKHSNSNFHKANTKKFKQIKEIIQCTTKTCMELKIATNPTILGPV